MSPRETSVLHCRHKRGFLFTYVWGWLVTMNLPASKTRLFTAWCLSPWISICLSFDFAFLFFLPRSFLHDCRSLNRSTLNVSTLSRLSLTEVSDTRKPIAPKLSLKFCPDQSTFFGLCDTFSESPYCPGIWKWIWKTRKWHERDAVGHNPYYIMAYWFMNFWY